MRKILFIALLFLPLITFADGVPENIPQPVMDALANDLAKLQDAVFEAQERYEVRNLAQKTWTSPKVKVTSQTFLRAGAGNQSKMLHKVSTGEVYDVVDRTGEWYAVEMKDPVNGLQTGWLDAASAVPVLSPSTAQSATNMSYAQQLFAELTDQAAKMKQAYQNNPYIQVTGFTIDMVPPSISINFDFKK